MIDRVYGTCSIEHPLLLQLLEAKPVQRLKKLNQSGASFLVCKNKDVTRYEHSVGVMLLLKMLGASIEEQAAGLLHDIPHTAFSHVADYVFENKEHDFHDRHYKEVLEKSDIPAIMKQHGYNYLRLLDETNYPLLEQPLPELCADRIDYSLRESVRMGNTLAKDVLSSLVVRNGHIEMTDMDIARAYALHYMELDRQTWSSPREVACYVLMSEAIKKALDAGVITMNDMFGDDLQLLKKMRQLAEAQAILEQLTPTFTTPNNIHANTKFRYIDPIVDGIHASSLPEVQTAIEKHRMYHQRMAKE